MSLSTLLAAALEARPDFHAGDPETLTVRDGDRRLALDLSAAGPLGVEFHRLEFSPAPAAPDRPERSLEALKSWGDRLAARVTYLMEPLIVLEADPVGGAVELRSLSPTPRGTLRSYYEILLDRQGTLRLHRIAFDEATRRRRTVPCQMSREVLERLADDLAATAD